MTEDSVVSLPSPDDVAERSPTASADARRAEHTPGPWGQHQYWPEVIVPANHVGKHRGGSVFPDVEAREHAKVIALVSKGTEYPQFHRSRVMPGEAEANARLIATAPDLLAAAKRVLSAPHGTPGNCDEMDAAMWALDHAVARADGWRDAFERDGMAVGRGEQPVERNDGGHQTNP